VTSTLTSIVAFSSGCTANFTVAHGLASGWKILVSGTVDATLGNGRSDMSTMLELRSTLF